MDSRTSNLPPASYDQTRWEKERRIFLQKHPLCEVHLAAPVPQIIQASVVDHKIPHKGNRELFWDQNNWQSLCFHCHSGYKRQLETQGTTRGCRTDGTPVDPNHPWNQTSVQGGGAAASGGGACPVQKQTGHASATGGLFLAEPVNASTKFPSKV
jgi:hypothetical protein